MLHVDLKSNHSRFSHVTLPFMQKQWSIQLKILKLVIRVYTNGASEEDNQCTTLNKEEDAVGEIIQQKKRKGTPHTHTCTYVLL